MKPISPSNKPTEVRPDAAAILRNRSVSPELSHLWRAIQKNPWHSLAIVPADISTDARPIADALVSTASLMLGKAPELLDGTGLQPSKAAMFILDMSLASQPREHGAVVVLDAVLANEACIPVAIAADAVVLVATLKEATFQGFTRTLELIGRDRVVGCITMRPAPPPQVIPSRPTMPTMPLPPPAPGGRRSSSS
ncbi:MAG TPA: hypothetical protein VFA20_23325 [Myxococcaceae bacterium]|nr:hypothetical protein [Myxococcaceae bacterium]